MKASIYKMLRTGALLFLLAALVLPSACAGGSKDLVSGTPGTVKFIDLEGGFYGIVGDDGKKYDPLNLSKDFQQDGLRIRFEAKPRSDVVGIHQWGAIVEITRVEKLAGK